MQRTSVRKSPGGTTVTSASVRQDDDVEKQHLEPRGDVEPLYTFKETMAWLHISDFTLRAWIKRPNDPLPRIVVGNVKRFSPSAVRAWMERQENAA